MNQPSRRQLLTAVGLSIGAAGCISDSEGSTRLGGVGIDNRHEEPHTVDFRVEWDDDLVHDQTYEVEANDPPEDRLPGALPERTWPDSAGQFVVSSRLDGTEWQHVDPADRGYPDCLGVQILISPQGTLAIYTSTSPSECESDNLHPEPDEEVDAS